jgi:hypothetical protein
MHEARTMLERSGVDEAPIWSIRRRRCVDRRTRAYKRWAARRAGFVGELGREPTVGEEELLDALTDLAIERDVMRAQRQAGRPIGRRTMIELVTETRRLRTTLGLGGEAELTLEQLLGVDPK